MSKINYIDLQNQSEIECTKRFLDTYNQTHNSTFSNITKNKEQNEIDIYCYDSNGNILNIQIKKADPQFAGDIGKSKKYPIDNPTERSISRNHDKNDEMNSIRNKVKQNIENVINKYINQNKGMSDIILLLDELTNPPQFIFENFKIDAKNTFKEIWFIPITKKPFRLI